MGVIKYAYARGAEIVFHGVTHQGGDLMSGFSGSSGSDYEFWSWPENQPLHQDSSAYLLRQLTMGEEVFNRLKLKPAAFEFPHYAGSALDNVLVGKLFEWNYHRSLYFKSEILQDVSLTDKERINICLTPECRKLRLKKLESLKVQADYTAFGTQMIPYPIFRDSYGQSLIPETIGCVDFPSYEPNTWRLVTTPEDLLRRAKKLRVIRGAMASFFWHPVLLSPRNPYYLERPGTLESIGGKKTLMTVVEGLKKLGYEFKSITDCSLFYRSDCQPSRN